MIGTVIKRERKKRGWTQGQLALRAGIDKAHISMIERGVRANPSVETMAKIANALHCGVDYILIEAKLLKRTEKLNPLGPIETTFIETLRQIPEQEERQEVLRYALVVARLGAEVERLRAGSRKPPEYQKNEQHA